MAEQAGNRWRPVIAALASPEVRVAFGLVLVGGDIDGYLGEKSPSRRRHIMDALMSSGVVEAAGSAIVLKTDVFAEILADAAPKKATGIGRFLANGRIAHYPASPQERAALLQWISERVLAGGETISEAELNGRLRVLADDTALLRRHLVDAGLVERRRDGSEYALATAHA